MQAQRQYEQQTGAGQITYPDQPPAYPQQGTAYPQQTPAYPQQGAGGSLYPSLDEYMGLQLTPQFVQQNIPGYVSICIIIGLCVIGVSDEVGRGGRGDDKEWGCEEGWGVQV